MTDPRLSTLLMLSLCLCGGAALATVVAGCAAPEPFNAPRDSGLFPNPDARSGGHSGGVFGTGGGFGPLATGGNGTGGVPATGGASSGSGGSSTGGAGLGSGGAGTGGRGTGGAATGGRGTGGLVASGGAVGTGGRGTGGAVATGGMGGRGSGGAASGGRGTGGATSSGGAGGGGTGTAPCSGLCAGATMASAGMTYGNLGTAATCHELIGTLQGLTCGNFVAPRTLSVNGKVIPCDGSAITLPAPRNRGYCIQTTAGQYAYAFFAPY